MFLHFNIYLLLLVFKRLILFITKLLFCDIFQFLKVVRKQNLSIIFSYVFAFIYKIYILLKICYTV